MKQLNRWREKIQPVGWRALVRRRMFVAAQPLWCLAPARPVGPTFSDVTLDVVIPVVEKDLPVLPHVLRALRGNVRHPLGELLLVAPDAPAIRRISAAEGCRFVLETEALPLQKAAIDYIVKGRDRSGWVWQQLVKLNADRICTRQHILVIDADTVLLQPHCFLNGRKSVLLFGDEFHQPYFETYRRLLGQPPASPVSFISHYMLMEAQHLAALRGVLEAKHGMPWCDAILAKIDRRLLSSFSEYETYGNFVFSSAPASVWLEYSRNGAVRRPLAGQLPGLADKLRGRFRSLSFHDYLA